MLKRALQELQRDPGAAKFLPADDFGRCRCKALQRGFWARVGNGNQRLYAGKLWQEIGDERQRVKALAGVEVAVRRYQYLRFNLPKSIDDGSQTKVRRAGRPDGAETRRR